MPVRRALAATVLLAACAPAPPAAEAPSLADAVREALVSTLSVETAGDTVRLSLRVTNAADGPLTLVFPSGQTYDFAVARGEETLWQWSANRRWIQAVREETLAPGETRAFTEAWVPEGGQRGALVARAWLTSSSHPVERTAGFALP